MNINDLVKRVDEIREAAKSSDHEHAHSLEDRLLRDFVYWLAVDLVPGPLTAHQVNEIQRLAQTVDSTKRIKFHRWCA